MSTVATTMITEVIYFGFELDLLEAHIAEHRSNVQHLIIAEAQFTSTGYPKPLYARENWSRFEKYDVELVELPKEHYNKLVPETNKPGFPMEGRLTPQEKHKKRWMHQRLIDTASWILHNDTDEIITDWPLVRKHLGLNPQWTHVALLLKECSGYVNVKTGIRDVYRFVRAVGGFDPAYAAKDLPRGLISPVPIGYHFHMCCSNPAEYYWKWLNRQDDWGSYGSSPPSLEVAVPMIERYIEGGLGSTSDPLLMFTGKHFPVPTSETIVELSDLPKFIRENMILFPRIEVIKYEV